jgi:hypothetical protein
MSEDAKESAKTKQGVTTVRSQDSGGSKVRFDSEMVSVEDFGGWDWMVGIVQTRVGLQDGA